MIASGANMRLAVVDVNAFDRMRRGAYFNHPLTAKT